MNLDGIDVFVKVVQVGSFSGAAKALKMPVTTVSGKVAALEQRLGTTLIQRTTRKLNVTQEGEVFFKRCVTALDEIRAGENEMNRVKVEPEGLLRITALADFAHSTLMPLVRTYLKKYPKVNIELILTERVVDLVGEGIDLAVRLGALSDSTLIARKYADSTAGLWASPEYLKKNGIPKHPRDLKNHTFIKFATFDEKLKLTRGLETHEVELVGRITLDDMPAMKSLTLNGDGIGMMTDLYCAEEKKSKKLVRVLPDWEWDRFVVSFVYPPQRFIAPKTQSFMAWVFEHAELKEKKS